MTTIISGAQFSSSESKSFTINLLATENFTSSKNIFLYPNPTKDIINISIGTELGLPESYLITNYLGQTIDKKVISTESDLSINVSSLTTGVYFVSVTKNDEKKVMRFIKE